MENTTDGGAIYLKEQKNKADPSPSYLKNNQQLLIPEAPVTGNIVSDITENASKDAKYSLPDAYDELKREHENVLREKIPSTCPINYQINKKIEERQGRK